MTFLHVLKITLPPFHLNHMQDILLIPVSTNTLHQSLRLQKNMSSVLLILLLSLSFSECNARQLKEDAKVSNTSTSFDPLSKGFEKVNANEVSVSPKPIDDRSSLSTVGKVQAGATAGKPKGSAKPTEIHVDETMKGTSAAAGNSSRSLDRVSRRVPRNGRMENPGFNVDYVEPRTHPPSHN